MGETIVSTAKYGTIITAVGKRKIAAALIAGTKVNLKYAAVGDGGGSYYQPTEDQTALKNECWRGEIAYSKVNELNPRMIDIKAIVPAEIGGFWVREVGLFDQEGDMIAVCNTPDAEKVAIADGASFPMELLLHIVVEDANTVQVSIMGSRSLRSVSAVIPAEGWKAAPSPSVDHNFICDVACVDSRIELIPQGTIVIGDFETARLAGMANGCETFDGYIRFFAKRIPKKNIEARIHLFGADNQIGDLPDDYVVSGNEETNQMLEEIFGD